MTANHNTSSARRLSGPRASRPVRVRVHVYPLGTLVWVCPDWALVSQQVTPKAFHGGHGRLRRRADVPAHFLGRKLEINPVCSKVICSGSLTPESCDLVCRQCLVIDKLLNQCPQARGCRCISLAVEAQPFQKSFRLSWVSLIFESISVQRMAQLSTSISLASSLPGHRRPPFLNSYYPQVSSQANRAPPLAQLW